MSQCAATNFSATELLQQAREITGLDIDDTAAVEPLTVLLEALNGESRLHEQGVAEYDRKLKRILSNRLRMIRDIRQHPEILEIEIESPVIICGTARTGSTKLQELLAASGVFNWLPFWQSRNPASLTGKPGEDITPRVEDTEEYVRWFDEASPEAQSGHEFDALKPDEESWILEHSLRTLIFGGWSNVTSYLQWLLTTQDLTQQFRYLKDALRYLTWQGLHDPHRRWVLKSPLYVGMEDALLEVFPDARLIMTHRSPLETSPSVCKLSNLFYKPHTDQSTDVSTFIDGVARQMQLHMDFRRRNPDAPILDIFYQDLITDEKQVIERIFAFSHATLTDAAKQRIANWSLQNPRHKKGTFNYSLDQFGFSQENLKNIFGEYYEFVEEICSRRISA